MGTKLICPSCRSSNIEHCEDYNSNMEYCICENCGYTEQIFEFMMNEEEF